MSGRADARTLVWRTVNATATGLVAGLVAVIAVRSVFGPDAVVVGTVVGVAAVVAGVAVSWRGSKRRAERAGGAGAMPPLRGRLHPTAWFSPVVGSVVAVVAWGVVAHSSGSGWVQAVGSLLAAVLVTGLVAPIFPARRATVTCTASPSDGEAGTALAVTLNANGPIRIRPRQPMGPVARAVGATHGWREVAVTMTPARRGVLDSVAVEVASCAPFGLLWWAREIEVPLPRPLHVAPRFGEAGPLDTRPEQSTGEAPRRVPSGSGQPRGVRPYQPGDTRRSIHWPATSHTGTLMVREKERQTDEPIVVDLTLPPDPLAAEAESERVMAALAHHLARGQPVILGTLETGGHTVRVVRDRIDLGRRLARAVSPSQPATGTPAGGPR